MYIKGSITKGEDKLKAGLHTFFLPKDLSD